MPKLKTNTTKYCNKEFNVHAIAPKLIVTHKDHFTFDLVRYMTVIMRTI